MGLATCEHKQKQIRFQKLNKNSILISSAFFGYIVLFLTLTIKLIYFSLFFFLNDYIEDYNILIKY